MRNIIHVLTSVILGASWQATATEDAKTPAITITCQKAGDTILTAELDFEKNYAFLKYNDVNLEIRQVPGIDNGSAVGFTTTSRGTSRQYIVNASMATIQATTYFASFTLIMSSKSDGSIAASLLAYSYGIDGEDMTDKVVEFSGVMCEIFKNP